MKQRQVINDISPDFKRDNETGQDYVERKKKQIVGFLAAYVQNAGAEGLVLGISGGVDSFLAGAFCAEAMRQIEKKLYLVLLPNGEQADFADAKDCADRLVEIYPGAEVDTTSIRGGYDGAIQDLGSSKWFSQDVYTLGNLQPRLRMMYQYALAKNMLVVGTDHATEAVTGFYTKYGDGGSDINPLQELVKDDIYVMAREFGAPEAVIEKKPAAGLGISADDESELGIKYSDICAYLKGNKIDIDVQQKLELAYGRSAHKRATPASLKDNYVEPKQETIVVVDLIYAFIEGEFQELACKKSWEAVENTIKYINEHPDANVFYARDWHPEDHCSFVENGGKWVRHAVQGTTGAEWAQSFYTDIIKTSNTPIERYNVFNKAAEWDKEGYSAVEAKNDAFGLLKSNLTEHVTVVGATTEYCISHTVNKLLEEGFHVTVPESCLAFVWEEDHAYHLGEMERNGAVIIKDAQKLRTKTCTLLPGGGCEEDARGE